VKGLLHLPDVVVGGNIGAIGLLPILIGRFQRRKPSRCNFCMSLGENRFSGLYPLTSLYNLPVGSEHRLEWTWLG